MDLINRPVWAEINLQKYARNLQQVRKRVGNGPLIMAVVKADAYGHGSLPLASKAIEAGVDRLAVALVEEGVELRQGGLNGQIQVMGGFVPEQIDAALENGLILTLNNLELARKLAEKARALRKEIKVHVKVDTGMGRMGPLPEDGVELVREVSKMEGLFLEGVMSHMSSADERDKDFTWSQFKKFQEIISALEGQGIDIPLAHVANSATLIDLPQMSLDMVRPGIMTYGLWPSAEVDQKAVSLEPVLEWKARLVQIKEVPGGSYISYRRTYSTPHAQVHGLIPMGFADGYSRLLSNQGEVLIGGKRAPVRGLVCMDQVVVDITEIPGVRVGDEVVVIGRQGEEEITADEIADKINTINYEIVCKISKRVPRFILE